MNLRARQETDEIEMILMKVIFPELERVGWSTRHKVTEAAVAIVDHYEAKKD